MEGVEDLDEVEDDPRRKVVIKADSSVSLGTMYDCLTHLDLSAEAETGMTKESLITSPEFVNSRRVVRGGVGVVSTADVMVAVAAEGEIV